MTDQEDTQPRDPELKLRRYTWEEGDTRPIYTPERREPTPEDLETIAQLEREAAERSS